MSDSKDYPSNMHRGGSTGRRGISNGAPSHKRVSPYPPTLHPLSTRTIQSVYPDNCSSGKDLQAYCLDYPEGRLQDSLFRGSARSLESAHVSPPLLPEITLSVPTGPNAFEVMSARQATRPATTQHGWQVNMHASSTQSFSSAPQQMFHLDNTSFAVENPDVAGRTKASKSHGSRPTTRRPTPDEFREMVVRPRVHEDRLQEYVGTDSKYTMAANHASIMVRTLQSHDLQGKMLEVTGTLKAINDFLEFLLSYQSMKSEQKGCVALRISFAALTALMGDFSQGEVPASDPNAPVVPKMYLPTFRQLAPSLGQLVFSLSQKLEKSINMYRHRRSPSNSLVTKFEGMLRTLSVWNEALRDETFTEPTRVIAHWLSSHPQQVDNKHRIQGRQQASPNLSDTGPSPSHHDESNFLSPQSAYSAVPTPRRPSHGSIRTTSGVPPFVPDNMPSLFSSRDMLSPPEHAPTYYPSTIDSHRYYDPSPYPSGDVLSGMYEHTFQTPSQDSSSYSRSSQGYSYP